MTGPHHMLRLPAHQTPFERRHLRRSHRMMLAFLWLNLPVFMGVAWFNNMSTTQAAVLTMLTLVGPTVATWTFPSARMTSIVHGVAAMCMGGVLVHLGQGPLQIEMHFYFFSLLATLAIFGNPSVILAATATIVLHHTLIWALLPRSIFNYDASIWVVAVHALFVIIEAVGVIFMARSFFDNVVGMEKKVEERTAALHSANHSMRLVMQHVNQGLLTLDRTGHIAPERSACVARWLGTPTEDTSFIDLLRSADPSAATWFELGWDDLLEDVMPVEVVIDQLPKRMMAGDRHLDLSYIPIRLSPTSRLDRLLVVMSDVSSDVEHARTDAESRQVLSVLEQVSEDRDAFQTFYVDASEMIDHLVSESSSDDVIRRFLHTLKGNALCYGLSDLGEHIHALETTLQEDQRTPSVLELAALQREWRKVTDALELIQHNADDSLLRVHPERLRALSKAIHGQETHDTLVARLEQLTYLPITARLAALARQAERVVERQGLPALITTIDDGDVNIPPDAWAALWPTLVHIVRNAVDHGLEGPMERQRAGKPLGGRLTLTARDTGDALDLRIQDDGRGIDWDAVRRRAIALGRPSSSIKDLHDALFTDGFTTRDTATVLSGRGVGLAAVQQACAEAGGSISLDSTRGSGTTWLLHLPWSTCHRLAA